MEYSEKKTKFCCCCILIAAVSLHSCADEKIKEKELISGKSAEVRNMCNGISSALRKAGELIKENNWQSANELINESIDLLSYRYAPDEYEINNVLIDDTGLQLTAAKALELKIGLTLSVVNMRFDILQSRFELFQRKYPTECIKRI